MNSLDFIPFGFICLNKFFWSKTKPWKYAAHHPNGGF